MIRFILRVLINAAALWIAGRLVGATIPAAQLNASLVGLGDLVVIALIFGFLNALVRPSSTSSPVPPTSSHSAFSPSS